MGLSIYQKIRQIRERKKKDKKRNWK
ncbi:hypothetical protein [Spiroplasma poulsonii]